MRRAFVLTLLGLAAVGGVVYLNVAGSYGDFSGSGLSGWCTAIDLLLMAWAALGIVAVLLWALDEALGKWRKA